LLTPWPALVIAWPVRRAHPCPGPGSDADEGRHPVCTAQRLVPRVSITRQEK